MPAPPVSDNEHNCRQYARQFRRGSKLVLAHLLYHKTRARALVTRQKLSPDIDGNSPPFPLLEPPVTQQATRHMPRKNSQPDMYWLQHAHLLHHKTDPQWHHHLRNDRDVEW